MRVAATPRGQTVSPVNHRLRLVTRRNQTVQEIQHRVLPLQVVRQRKHRIGSKVHAEVEEGRTRGPTVHLKLCLDIMADPIIVINGGDTREFTVQHRCREYPHLVAEVANVLVKVLAVRWLRVLEPRRVWMVIEDERATLLTVGVVVPVVVRVCHKGMVGHKCNAMWLESLQTKVVKFAQLVVIVTIVEHLRL